MKIWHLDFDVDKYSNLMPINEKDLDSLEFDGSSKKDKWEPMEVELDGDKLLGDVTCLALIPGIPVFNAKVIKEIRNFIESSVEILPLVYNNDEFYVINITEVLDCIDYKKSKYVTFKSSGRIMRFERYFFNEECIKGKHIFKIKDEPKRRAFVSDEFRLKVLESRISGFKFELVWES